jgi:hypothetical protein
LARLIRLQFRFALSAILAAVLGGIWIGKQTRITPGSSPIRTSNEPLPKPVELVKKYALAEFAALIGIPLALAGLALTAFATRDTARQLQLVKAQSQPTFSITLRQVDPTDMRAGHDELAIVLGGNAESITVNVDSALILRGHLGKPRWMLFPYTPWTTSPPKVGRVANFRADPSFISDLRNQTKQIILASTITINYIDLFGEAHAKYYQFTEVVSNSGSVHYPREVTQEQGSDCVELIETFLTELTRSDKGTGDTKYVLHKGAVWPTVRKLAHEVTEHQALRCLGPPFGRLR